MTFFIKKPKAILIFIPLLFLLGPQAKAVYSPTLYQHVQLARQHVRELQAHHGVGTVANAWDAWMGKERLAKEQDAQHARVLPANYDEAIKTIKTYKQFGAITLAWDDAAASFDTIFGWMTGSPYSACVRDDIFELEDTIQQVATSMIRAAILADDRYALLKKDFEILQNDIHYLRQHPEDPLIDSVDGVPRRYLFPDGETNYYLDQCPANEWQNALEDFMHSYDYFIGSLKNIGDGTAWGSLTEMAKIRARQNASEYFKRNQISFTLAGESGAKTTSLRKKGRDGVEAEWRVFKEEVTTLIGPVRPFFTGLYTVLAQKSVTCTVYRPDKRVWQECNEQEKIDFAAGICYYCLNPNEEVTAAEIIQRRKRQQNAREVELQRADQTIRYRLHFGNISESATEDFDAVLFQLNSSIAAIYDEKYGASLPKILGDMSYIKANYCKNR